MTARAEDVAAAIIERGNVDQRKLQKLLYLVQAASLIWLDRPAFDDRHIEAWAKGPVVRGVVGHYKGFGVRVIEKPVSGDPARVDPDTLQVVETIVRDFGGLTANELEAITKRPGSPWRLVRGDLPDGASSGREIPSTLINSFHRKHALNDIGVTPDEAELIDRFLAGDGDALADYFEEATGIRPSVT